MIEKNFAANVRFYRRAQELTQANLAELVNCSEHSIRRIERNEKAISLDEANAIAQALGFTLDVMMSENEFRKKLGRN